MLKFMDKYGLIGYPLGHSMSPLIHNKLFALSGIEDFSYELIEIAPEKLAESGEMQRHGEKVSAGYKIFPPILGRQEDYKGKHRGI